MYTNPQGAGYYTDVDGALAEAYAAGLARQQGMTANVIYTIKHSHTTNAAPCYRVDSVPRSGTWVNAGCHSAQGGYSGEADGWIATVRCTGCGATVSRWSDNPDDYGKSRSCSEARNHTCPPQTVYTLICTKPAIRTTTDALSLGGGDTVSKVEVTID